MFAPNAPTRVLRLAVWLVLIVLTQQSLGAKEVYSWLDEPIFEASVELGSDDCPSTDFSFTPSGFFAVARPCSRCTTPQRSIITGLALPHSPLRAHSCPLYLRYRCLKVHGGTVYGTRAFPAPLL